MVDLEKHYLNILYRMDMMIDAAKRGDTVVASEINKFGGRSWSRCYYIFINAYTGLKTGLALAQNVRSKNGELCAGAEYTLPFIYDFGNNWDLIGRPSFEDFKGWYNVAWKMVQGTSEFRKAQAGYMVDNGLDVGGYNNRITCATAEKLN